MRNSSLPLKLGEAEKNSVVWVNGKSDAKFKYKILQFINKVMNKTDKNSPKIESRIIATKRAASL